MSKLIFSLFWEGALIRRGEFIRGGAFILKSEILGGRLFEAGRLFEEIRYFEFQETNVFFSLNTIIKPTKQKIRENNSADSNCLRQIPPVVAACMEITYHFIYRPRG